MSATNRGSARIEHDTYSTPSWCTRRILEALNVEYMRGLSFREPCAGEGAISRVIEALVPDTNVIESDIRAVRGIAVADAVVTPNNHVSVCITNPPYKLAEEIIRAQLPACQWGIFLVRQGFMSSAKRAAWLRSDMPDTYDLPNRPSFAASLTCIEPTTHTYTAMGENEIENRTGCGWRVMQALNVPRPSHCPKCGGSAIRVTTSDASDYCWLVWTPERNRTEGRRFILPVTSAEERAAG